jgi:hypothetical protein
VHHNSYREAMARIIIPVVELKGSDQRSDG